MRVAGPYGLSGEPEEPGAGPSARRRAAWSPAGDLRPPRSRCAPGSGRTDPPAGSASAPCRWAQRGPDRPGPSPAPSGSPRAAAHPTTGCACCTAAAAAAVRSGCLRRNPDAPRASGTADAAAPAPPAAAGRGSLESPCIPAPAAAAPRPRRAGASRTPAPPAPGPAGTPPRAPAPGLPRPGAPPLPPATPRGRQVQNRGLWARIGHAPGIIPAPLPAGTCQFPAGVRAGGPQTHRLPPCRPRSPLRKSG